MAFQTNVFRDGEWITETVDIRSALQASATRKSQEALPDRGPSGILSSTVVNSPTIHKILPVCLRSRHHNDIAFIGDNTVTVREMRDNGQTYEIATFKNFGSRIRSAAVLGPCPDSDDLEERHGGSPDGRMDGIDMAINNNGSRRETSPSPCLPPQILVLTLGTGELAFLFIKEVGSRIEFCIQKHEPPREIPYFGQHLAIDPSSQFIAVSSWEDFLMIYEIESRGTLEKRYQETGSTGSFVKGQGHRLLRTTIFDLQFLYPRPEDDYHVILMALISSKNKDGSGRYYLTWDWEFGEDWKATMSRPNRRRLMDSSDVPMFSIPLKASNSFFIVYPKFIGLVKDPLVGSIYDFNQPMAEIETSRMYHGATTPLWTSWARPFRRKEYSAKTDTIYLAREDGSIQQIEVDSESILISGQELGSVGTNIGTAFTTAYDRFSDLLIVGSESAPGGIWKLAARSELEQVSTFPSWSPVVDMALMAPSSGSKASSSKRPQNPKNGRPDRLFFASGRGVSGSLVELRIGLKARIGIDLDIGEPVRQAWLFPNIRQPDGGDMLAILALPHSTTVLSIASGFADVSAELQDATPFDINSRTLHAKHTEGMVVQASEKSLTLITASQSSRHALSDLLSTTDSAASKAFCLGDTIILAVQSSSEAHLHVLHVDQMDVALTKSWKVSGDVTSLCLFHSQGKQFVIVGSVVAEVSVLSIYSLCGELMTTQEIDNTTLDISTRLEAFTSICATEEDNTCHAVAGTRCGHLLTIRITIQGSSCRFEWTIEKIGETPVEVFPSSNLTLDAPSALAVCDGTLLQLSSFSERRLKFEQKDIVWPTDVSDPSLPAPPIHSVFTLPSSVEGSNGNNLLLLSGTGLLVADLETRVGAVPRQISLGCTPTRVIFSNTWNCLVVGVQKERGVDLLLIDPDTGLSISKPINKDKGEGQLSSFDCEGDKIIGLLEWNFTKDGQMFPFVVATLQSGRLVIVSVSQLTGDENRRLQHFTRYRKKGFQEPVYSVVADEEGLIYCAGRHVYRDVLDLTERKLRTVKAYELGSPATTLEIVNDKLFALTLAHSVEVLDFQSDPSNPDMQLLHSDGSSRNGLHLTRFAPAADEAQWPVTIISERMGGIAGLWLPPGQSPRDLITVFEGQLDTSVRKFLTTRCRPAWSAEESLQPRFGSFLSTANGAEIIGSSLDGTIRHFTLLDLSLWRLLDLIQRLARKSARTSAIGIKEDKNAENDGVNGQRQDEEMGGSKMEIENDQGHYHDGVTDLSEIRAEPKNMHIDGDILRVCLDERLLEVLVAEADCTSLFCRYLDDLEEGVHTSSFSRYGASADEVRRRYFELGYDVLEYLLRPVV